MPDRWRGLEAIFAGVIAFFTIVLGVVSYFQWNVAIEAADAAKKSAEIAHTSLVKLQSASVFVADIDSNWHPDLGNGRKGKFWWHFRPILQNAGSTQTINMKTNVVFEFRNTPLPKDFRFPPNKMNTPAFIPPHGFIYGEQSFLTQEQMVQIQKGQRFFYIYGTLTYRDIFEDTPVHTTKFCRQVLGLLGDFTRPNKNKTEMLFEIAFPEQNTAD